MTKKKQETFVGKVSNFGSGSDGRKHIEIPKDKRSDFQSGDAVFIEKIKR